MTPDRKEPWTVQAFRLGSAGALLLSQVGCLPRGQKNPDASPPPTPITETVPSVALPATEISPSPGAGETIVITEQRYMSQQEALAVDPSVESKFQEFQEEIKVNNPSATFAAWGALATAQTGETYFTPFFEVYINGNLTGEYVNIGKIDGSIATLELKPGEVEGPDGKIYVSLSQTVNADTNELLEKPWPYIWIPYSRAEYHALPDDQKAKVLVYFSAIPGIVPRNEAPVYGGAKTENIRMIIATPTETPPLPQEFLDQFPDLQFQTIDNQIIDSDGVVWFEVNEAREWEQKVFTMRQAMIKMDKECDPWTKKFENGPPPDKVLLYLWELVNNEGTSLRLTNVVGTDESGIIITSCWYVDRKREDGLIRIIYGVLDESTQPPTVKPKEIVVKELTLKIVWEEWPPSR